MPYKDPADARKWYGGRSPEAIARKKEKNAERRQFHRDVVCLIKLSSGCTDCGYRGRHEVLEFDHLRDKEFDVSTHLTCSFERIMNEIAKCEVVCSNCHRIREADRRLANA